MQEPRQKEFIAAILERDLTIYEQSITYLMDKVTRVQIDFADNTLVDSRTVLPKQIPVLPESFDADAHLMVTEPSQYFEELYDLGFQRVVVHAEAAESIGDSIAAAHEFGLAIAVTLSPETPLAVLLPFADEVDFLQLMGVYPGAGGQEMLPETVERLKLARELYPHLRLAVDGGVRLTNVAELLAADAEILVVGKRGFLGENQDGPLLDQWQNLLS